METIKYKLKDIVSLLNGRAFLMPELQAEGKYRILRVGNLSGGNDSWYYSDMELDENKYCQNGDLLYSWACNFGPHIWKEEKVIYHYHVWKLKINSSKVNKKFLYYYLLYNTPYYLGGVNGAAMVHITKQSMEKKTVIIPKELIVQNKIASILSAYDNLIENNNKRIKLLEKQAKEIYKEWFVRFRFPGYESTEFVDGIPKSWEFDKLEKLCSFDRGKNITAEEMEEGEIPVISAGLAPSGYHKEANVTGPSITISSSGANAGFLSFHESDIWAADCSYVSGDKVYNIYYIYQLLNNMRDIVTNLQRGAAQPHVYPRDVNRLKVLIPSLDLQDKANKIFAGIYHYINKLQKQNKNLVRQRDLLLPRLMSGKLEVKPE